MGYVKSVSNFLRKNRNSEILNHIVKGSLIVYALLLFGGPLSAGFIPLPTPEQMIFLFLTYAVFVGKGVGFLKDLAPLVILFFAYEAMRGVVVGNEQRIITQYWSSSNAANGLEINVTPGMANLGDSVTINLKSSSKDIQYADLFIIRIGGGGQTASVKGIRLDGGMGSYSIGGNDIFVETGAYDVTAFANGNPAVTGSSVVGITRNVHYKEPLIMEKALFGFIPSAYLQEQLYRPGHVSVIDLISILAYCLHFVVPFLFASVIWFKDRELYTRYSASFLVLSYAGLVTFLLYPAAPPWLASQVGYTNGVTKVYDETSKVLNLVILPSVYYLLNANEVAAIPSLHVAFPLLVAIFSAKLWGKKGWAAFLYPITVAFSLVYLGEHYFVDIVAGVVYTLAALLLVELIFRRERKKRRSNYKPEGRS